jgi:hypothetical protein
LFGIELFEGDTGIVAHAADCLRARVRSIRPGGHLAEWQALLDEVAAGKSCLLNPDTKVRYDARLRGWAVPPAAAQPESAVSPIPDCDGKPQLAAPAGLNRWTGARDPISPVAIPSTRTAADSRLVATPPFSQNQDPPIIVETPSVEAFREAVQTSGVPRRRISANRLMALALPVLLTVSLGSVGYMFLREHQQREAEGARGGDGPNTLAGESPPHPIYPSTPM